jgi:hypothetical protein
VTLSKSPALDGGDWPRPVSWSKRDGPLLELVFGAVFLPVGSLAAWTCAASLSAGLGSRERGFGVVGEINGKMNR